MHLIGRWAQVRTLGPRGWGLPWMLDRKWHTLSGFHHDEWHRMRSGLWVPAISGGSFSGRKQHGGMLMLPLLEFAGAVTQQTVALDSNFSAGTGGDAIAIRFVLPETLTLASVYCYIVSYTGTAANVNDLLIEIRPDNAGVPDTSTLTDSESKDPASATGWVATTIATPPSLTAGTTYWAIVGDPDGNGTDFATLLRNASSDFNNGGGDRHIFLAGSTTGGWASGNTFPGRRGSIVLTFSDSSAWGNPFATSASPTSNSLQKGLRIGGFTEQIKIYGAFTSSSTANYSGLNLWEGTNGPGGSADETAAHQVFQAAGASEVGFLFGSPVTLSKATAYRLVFTYAANAAVPLKVQIGTGADASLQACMLGGGEWYWTEEVAGPAWSDDDEAWPNMALLVEDQVAITSGSQGISQGLHTIMDGIVA